MKFDKLENKRLKQNKARRNKLLNTMEESGLFDFIDNVYFADCQIRARIGVCMYCFDYYDDDRLRHSMEEIERLSK